MDIKQIAMDWLAENGYEGLAHAELECGCDLDDFMPCGEVMNLEE